MLQSMGSQRVGHDLVTEQQKGKLTRFPILGSGEIAVDKVESAQIC